MKCEVIDTKYVIHFSSFFINEVERVVHENTKETNGTSERTQQLGQWITILLRFIQSLGNLDDTSNYTWVNNHYEYNTNIYHNGIGVFSFVITYDNDEKTWVVTIENVSWNFNSNRLFNQLFEKHIDRIAKKQLKQYINECVREVLKEIKLVS